MQFTGKNGHTKAVSSELIGGKNMRSIISIALAAVMMLTVFTGCGRNKNNTATKPAVTNAPVAATERPAVTTPNAADNNGNNVVNDMAVGVEDAVNGVVNGAENAVNGVVNGAENAVNDMVNSDKNDGRVEDKDNVVRATPQAR